MLFFFLLYFIVYNIVLDYIYLFFSIFHYFVFCSEQFKWLTPNIVCVPLRSSLFSTLCDWIWFLLFAYCSAFIVTVHRLSLILFLLFFLGLFLPLFQSSAIEIKCRRATFVYLDRFLSISVFFFVLLFFSTKIIFVNFFFLYFCADCAMFISRMHLYMKWSILKGH